ncbi:hypothetical protein ACJIZ3_022528 [Penstemon smallii]|uniref:AIPP2-like SPOC-like domain-containing protein n=1 Tax=Penstemon smallii TaxID=265156 RepID=A0ABD3TNJ9_9LAMI
MNSTDEFAGEACAENAVVDQGKRHQIRQLSEMSVVAGMSSNSDSFSENAVGKTSSRTSDASDENVVHSKFEGRRVPEGHDDCLSCISGTVEHANRKSDTEDSRIKCGRENIISGESSEKVPSSSSPTGLSSQNSCLMEIPTKTTYNATDSLKVHDTFSQASCVKSPLRDQNSRDIKDDNPSNTTGGFLEGSSEPLISLQTKDVASDVCGDPLATVMKSTEKNDDMQGGIQPTDETDDSDMVEHDVKVCDICGDAGREELLAICCRCTDGAEHTYCMREMLDKVPEGDWLCEECKTVERVKTRRKENIGRADEYEKNNSSGQASSDYVNSSDVEGHRTEGLKKFSGKRRRDDADAEVSSKVKKPALEPTVGSPKTTISSKTAALSRENSMRNLDKGRLQPPTHSSSDTVERNGDPDSLRTSSDRRVQNFRGNFSKSNSFNSLNLKPKVKLVDQVVLQRQKSAREHSSFRLKESVSRSVGKSMSFKSANSGRSESKIKMLSPRDSHILDMKNTKQQRSSFERQSSFKTEHPSINSVMGASVSSNSRIDRKLPSRGESSSLITTTNHTEKKPVQTDGKTAALSRSSSLAARRNADLSSSLGEFKRPSLHSRRTLGVSSANLVNNTEQKSNLTSPKEDSSSCSVVAERPPLSGNVGLPDELSRSRDFGNSGERTRESSGSRVWTPSVKSSRDESNNVKAAIEAAVLRKPGVYRKHRASGQSDDLSHQDHLPNYAGKKKLYSSAELPEKHTVSLDLSADSLKQETINNVKNFSLVSGDDLSSVGGDGVPIVPLVQKSSLKDMFSNIPSAMPISFKLLAIPEHEYIWQGSFEICQSGKNIDLWDGIQAHLSTCASPKVVESVNKFKSKIVLYEVPRLSTWPVQFQEHGVKEDNIALFFFAKDLESYNKIYKVLLDNMMKNDLALRGNVNGVELLIFPSNQLPDNAQRWNMLFFLWGVFRGKKESSLQLMPESMKQFCAPRDISPAIMSLPENRCSLGPIPTDSASDDTVLAPKNPAPDELCSLLSSRAVNGDYGTKASSLDRSESKLNSSSTAPVQIDSGIQCQEPGNSFLERDINSRCGPPLQATRSTSGSGGDEIPMQLDTPLDIQHSSHHLNKSAVATRDMDPDEAIGEKTLTINQDKVQFRMDVEDLSPNGETPSEEYHYKRDLNTEYNRWPSNHKDPLHPESCVVPQTLFPITSQVLARSADTCIEPLGAYEEMNLVSSGSHLMENPRYEACNTREILDLNEDFERRFFPMEQPLKGEQLVDRSMPWKIPPQQERLHDKAPNLELVLGAETKPLSQSIRPLQVGKSGININEEHIFNEAGIKTEDDVSASLSLSLSFPFPENEQSTKPAPKTEQLVSERERPNTSMLLFGGLRDK